MCTQSKLSEDYLETLRLDACGLGSVSEEAEACVDEKETFTLSSYEKVCVCVCVCVCKGGGGMHSVSVCVHVFLHVYQISHSSLPHPSGSRSEPHVYQKD